MEINDPVAVVDAELAGQLGADLGEALRLKLSQPGHPAAHAAGGVVLGQTVGGENVRESRVSDVVIRLSGRSKNGATGLRVCCG